MGSEMDQFENRVIAMLNTQLSNGEKDFGKIIEYVVITYNSARRYVFITDTGRRIGRFCYAFYERLPPQVG